MKCEHLRELMAHDVIGLLQPADGARLKRHLEAGCPGCAAEYAALRETVGHLPYALVPEEPPPGARARLLEAIRRETAADSPAAKPAAIRPAVAGGWWRLAAAALIGAVLTGIPAGTLVVRQGASLDSYRGMVEGLQEQIDRQEETLAALQRQVRDATASIQMVSAPGVSVVDLAGQGNLTSASARVFWDPRREAWQIHAANLPPPAHGRTYQLWLITAEAKVSAGVFDAAAPAPAAGTVRLPEGARAVAAAITDEPAGGSPQPTGSILLLGNISTLP